MLFKEVMKQWLSEKQYFFKESIYARYNFEVTNYLMPVLGDISLTEVTEEAIQHCVLEWQNTGMSNGHPFKKSTVQNLVMIIKQILRYVVKKGYTKEIHLDIHFD